MTPAATGGIHGDGPPRGQHPYRYVPAFAPGRYRIDMELDTCRRCRGAFEVTDLRPSHVPIRVSVSLIR